jgi:phage baseplate assembly protein gpV
VLIEGTLTARDDVIGGGKSLKGHRHGGVQSGSSHTAAPD